MGRPVTLCRVGSIQNMGNKATSTTPVLDSSGKDKDGNWPKYGDDGRWGKWGRPKDAHDETAKEAAAGTTKPPPKRAKRAREDLPTIALIGGTGRMGVHLCAAWANAGYDVTMCSRTKEKAEAIVESLLSGHGYHQDAMQGAIDVPACPADGWILKAGTNLDAADADLIVLGTMYEETWSLLEAVAPRIRGKGKMILDMTNPFLKRPDGYGAGLPKDGPQAGILIHQQKLADPSAKWVGAYKTVMWSLILPDGPSNPSRPDIEVFGDPEAVTVVSS